MLCFLRKRAQRVDWKEWCADKNGIMKHAFASDVEVLLFYKEESYYGYIDMRNPLDRMVPEYNVDFVPHELECNETIFDRANELFIQCKKLKIIPLKLSSQSHDITIFISRTHTSILGMAMLALDTYNSNERVKSLFLNELLKNKALAILSDLDEFTYKCYVMLKNAKIQIRVEGFLWEILGIQNDSDGLVSEDQILYVIPEQIYEVSTIINVREIVYTKKILSANGVKAYAVSIPSSEQIERSLLEEVIYKAKLSFCAIAGKKQRTELENWFVNKILGKQETEEAEEISEEELKHPKVLGNEAATIFLVGPCIVEGNESIESHSLAKILSIRLQDELLKYQIRRVIIPVTNMAIQKTIETLDIKDNDIVFFFYTDVDLPLPDSETSIKLLPVYKKRKKDELFFSDFPIHTLRAGNEAIAEFMMPYIRKEAVKEEAGAYLQAGMPALDLEEKRCLDAYIQKVKVLKRIGECERVGAIVMNANPFTRGHLHLIEQAASMVTYLYIMAVEEDLSEFCFEDRIRLIKEGTDHLKNVIVIPSGSFILSQHTMSAYFEKEELQESRIDASRDVAFFGAHIAPALSIKVRFVGEEPLDSVTRQYNEEMKKKLPLYGIEVIEIPRVCMEEKIISASLVRRLYQKEEWDILGKLVPETTMCFLQTRPKMRNKKELVAEREANSADEQSWEKLFSESEKVVLYATGADGKGVYSSLTEREKEKVYFADIKAEQSEYQFCGKTVVSPHKLLTDLKKVPIIITTTLYRMNVCEYLLGIGVDLDRMYQNRKAYLT